MALVILVVTSGKGTGQTTPPARPPLPPGLADGPVLPVAPDQPWSDAEAAGLPPGSRPAVLTWERAYMLAVIRSRTAQNGQGRPAETLDTETLPDRAARLGFADFARFRREFLTGRDAAGGAFRDPSGPLLDLLRRDFAVDAAQRHVRAREANLKTIEDLISGGSTVLTQSDIDHRANVLSRARRRLAGRILAYRDRLEEAKVELGLSPHAPVVPDRMALEAFRVVFDATDEWFRNPERELEDLPRLVARLPRLDDPVLGAVAGLPARKATDPDPGRLEEVLSAVERAAAKNRLTDGDDGGAPAVRVRRRARHLLAIQLRYVEESQALLVALRLKNLALEELIQPPGGNPPSSPRGTATALVDQMDQVVETEVRLVDLWAAFHTERLALANDLSSLPDADWASFLGRLAPRPVADDRAPPLNPAAPPTPPAGAR